jgi:hypothetical protein
MTEARIGFSIVTMTMAAGYPECEALTAHPLALFGKRCDEGAEYVGQTSEARRAANRLFSDVASAPMAAAVVRLRMRCGFFGP